MISDQQLKSKIDILTNKLKAELFDEVIAESKSLLKKRYHQIFYNMLSLSYQSLGKFDLSIKIMEEGLRKDPNNPFFLNNIGISHHKLNHFKEAETYLKKGLKIAPKYSGATVHVLDASRSVPVVGNLFKNNVKTTMQTELLIFVTPRIVNDSVSRNH